MSLGFFVCRGGTGRTRSRGSGLGTGIRNRLPSASQTAGLTQARCRSFAKDTLLVVLNGIAVDRGSGIPSDAWDTRVRPPATVKTAAARHARRNRARRLIATAPNLSARSRRLRQTGSLYPIGWARPGPLVGARRHRPQWSRLPGSPPPDRYRTALVHPDVLRRRGAVRRPAAGHCGEHTLSPGSSHPSESLRTVGRSM